jgi:hypothetical protein
MRPFIKFQSVVLDCKQPAQLANFYMNLLGGEITYDIGVYVAVAIPGENVCISCQLEENYIPPIWPDTLNGQMKMEHLDFDVTNMEEAVQFALSLGATKPEIQYWQPEYGSQWVTLLDPAGHPFCFCLHE